MMKEISGATTLCSYYLLADTPNFQLFLSNFTSASKLLRYYHKYSIYHPALLASLKTLAQSSICLFLLQNVVFLGSCSLRNNIFWSVSSLLSATEQRHWHLSQKQLSALNITCHWQRLHFPHFSKPHIYAEKTLRTIQISSMAVKQPLGSLKCLQLFEVFLLKKNMLKIPLIKIQWLQSDLSIKSRRQTRNRSIHGQRCVITF